MAAQPLSIGEAEHPHSRGTAHGFNLTITPPPPVTFETLDPELLSSLDGVLTLLDTQPTGLLRRCLLIRKEWYERQVPAWYPEVQS